MSNVFVYIALIVMATVLALAVGKVASYLPRTRVTENATSLVVGGIVLYAAIFYVLQPIALLISRL